MAGQEKPPAGPAAEEGAPESSDVLHIVEPEDPMPDAGPGPLLTEGKLGLGLQARVVAQKKAPTVAAQTERRDRKVVAAVQALAAQKTFKTRPGLDEGVTVVWSKLEYALPLPQANEDEESYAYRKKIMMNMSGRAEPGNFLAIMGPEGSGKSLLLHMLAGRVRADNDSGFRGTILYNGEAFTDSMRREIGLVEQDAELEENLTVKETLMYAALLRLPQGTEEIDRIVRVEHVLDSLELTQRTFLTGLVLSMHVPLRPCPFALLASGRVADTVLRSSGRGVKVALHNERRRLSIGVQMLINPPLLLLDEPTSGLDGAMALRLTRALHSYARAGRTVIASMKQPSNRMFSFFTHLLLTAEGNPIYYGPASTALSYFDSCGFSPSPDSSPAEFFLDLTAPEAPDASIHFGTTTNLVRLWQTGETARALDQGLRPAQALPAKDEGSAAAPLLESSASSQGFGSARDLEAGSGGGEAGVPPAGKHQRWVTSWLFQFSVLARRHMHASVTLMKFDSLYVSVAAFSFLLCCLLPGLLWYQRPSTAIGIREELGLIFFMCLFWGLVPMLATIITFTENRKVVRKELEDGVYHTSAYYASRTLLYLPFEVVPPTVFCCMVYWMAGLNPWFGRFVAFTVTLILETLVASSWGFFIGAVSSTVYQAIGTATIVQLLSTMVVHFLVLDPPAWIGWSQYLSFSAYAYRLLSRINFPGVDSCAQVGPASDLQCMYTDGDFVVETPWELADLPGAGWIEGMVLLLMFVILRVAALLVIRVRMEVGRKKTIWG